MVFGCFNNIVVIIVVAGTKKLRTPMNAILLNLSVSDFLISLLGTPFSFASAINREWLFGPIMCEIYAFCMTLTDDLTEQPRIRESIPWHIRHGYGSGVHHISSIKLPPSSVMCNQSTGHATKFCFSQYMGISHRFSKDSTLPKSHSVRGGNRHTSTSRRKIRNLLHLLQSETSLFRPDTN
ncbi:hypothetical protein AVEN_201319-1 [Araneus ventricosus]|uniref:G-protein coupled receptors family 1 profile domain-containing protein n=1 Tax=Araneus ventricosus TaxID=182803 RepID=A0A4Y2KG37_ARAVE|nr:hypothetical protein AVEN_201319-1 [Araneus ventricosus]